MHVEIHTRRPSHPHGYILGPAHIYPRLERYRFSVFLSRYMTPFFIRYTIYSSAFLPVHIGRLNHTESSDRRQILQVYPVKHINHFPFPAGWSARFRLHFSCLQESRITRPDFTINSRGGSSWMALSPFLSKACRKAYNHNPRRSAWAFSCIGIIQAPRTHPPVSACPAP